MIISIGKKDLFSPLKRVSGLCKSHSSFPILDSVLVESDGETLTFTASNLESQHSDSVLFASDPFALCIPAAKLTAIVGLLADQDVRLSFEQPAVSVQLRAGSSRHTLNCLPPENFPRFDRSTSTPDERWSMNMEAGALRFALAWVRDAMAINDSRFFLCGALLECTEENRLTVVASDGHRLSKASVGAVTSESCEGGRQFILPRNAVLELLKLLPDDEDCRVQLDFMPTALAVSWPGFQTISKAIDGRYPDWRRVSAMAGSDQVTSFSIDAGDAVAALKRCKLVGHKQAQFRGVSVEIVGDEARFSSSSDGESAFETVLVGELQGGITVGFNVDYLIDALACIGGTVAVSLSENKGIFEASSDAGGDCFHVVMPMRL